MILGSHIHADKVAQFHLACSHQIGQWENQVAFDRPLQVPRTVTRVSALPKQKLLRVSRTIEHKLVGARSHEHALLHHAEFDLKNLRQMFVAQRLEHHRLVDAVHELGRELAPRCLDRGALNFVVEVVVDFHHSGRKAQATVHQIGHLAGAQV